MIPSLLEYLDVQNVDHKYFRFFADILDSFPDFLGIEENQFLAQLLSSPTTQLIVFRDLRTGSRSLESRIVLHLLRAYAVAAHREIASAEDPHNRIVGQLLFDLLACQGTPGIDDSITPGLIRFWSKYIDHVQNSVCAEDGNLDNITWVHDAYQMMSKVVEAYWRKSCWPDGKYSFQLDSEAETSFIRFRANVKTLFQAASRTFGLDIFKAFTLFAISSHHNAQWALFEASIFAFNAVSDSLVVKSEGDIESEEEDKGTTVEEVLSGFFSSGVFGDMMAITPHMASKVKLQRLDMLHKYAVFFNNRSQYFPELLTSLFVSLKDPELANSASKAIRSIGLACRKSLAPELGTFLQQYAALFALYPTKSLVKENVMGAIAAIIQALPTEEEKGHPLRILLEYTANHQAQGIELIYTDFAKGRFRTVCTLRCLVAMGNSLQVPKELQLPDDDLASGETVSTYWSHGPGKALQDGLVTMMSQATNALFQDGEAMEAICNILRAGYNESRPGLFVFAPAVTVEFVQSARINTARLAYVFETAGIMLAKQDKPVQDGVLQYAAYNVLHSAQQLAGKMDGMQYSLVLLIANVV